MNLFNNVQNIAVTGVTIHQEKYGYIIYQHLKNLNYHVYGITPMYEYVDGDKMYPTLMDIPDDIHIDLVVFVTAPKYNLNIIDHVHQLNITKCWLQPNTYDNKILDRLNQLNIQYQCDCVLKQDLPITTNNQ